MKKTINVTGKEKHSVLDGIVYLLTQEFDGILFMTEEEFNDALCTTKDDNIENREVFVESDYMIQTVDTNYLLYAIGTDIDLPRTYKIIKHVREIKSNN